MKTARRSGLQFGLLLCSVLLIGSVSAGFAQREGGSGIFDDLLGGLKTDGAAGLERRARATDQIETARDLYATLLRRNEGSPFGVRAALWLGRDAYGVGRIEEGLRYFETARKHAVDPIVQAEATFWCEVSRSLSGREPLDLDTDSEPGGPWETLTRLVQIDRAMHQGDKRDAERMLLSLEGAARRDQVMGLCVARWADLMRMPGGSRLEAEEIGSWMPGLIDLPERLRLTRPVEEIPEPEQAWALLFGNYLEEESAVLRQEEIRGLGIEAVVEPTTDGGQQRYRVLLGPFATKAEAETTAIAVPELSTADYLIIRSP